MEKKSLWIPICFILIVSIIYLSSYKYAGFAKNTGIQASTLGKEVKKQDIPGSDYFFNTYSESDLSIEDVGLFSNSEKVVKVFGFPSTKNQKSRIAFENPDYIEYIDTWVYPEITIRFSTCIKKGNPPPVKPNKVIGIIVTGPKYKTKRGIKIGDFKNKVFEKYGITNLENDYYCYQIDTIYIRFKITNETVNRIEIGGLPD